MKFSVKNTFAALATTILLTACSSDDNTPVAGTGSLGIEFDNAFQDNDLILGAPNTTSANEVLKITEIKYIVSNIVLTKTDGTTVVYPKSESYFIVDETEPGTLVFELENIPAGDYSKIKFGIGVDPEQYALGAAGQGNFLAEAQTADLFWSWSAGYKFLAFEGNFTSASIASDTPFMVHTGKTGTDYNYTEITLNLPSNALVRTDITPEIHVVADVSKIIDGGNKIHLSDHNMMGMGAMIMSGAALPQITANLNGMFHVAHVHND